MMTLVERICTILPVIGLTVLILFLGATGLDRLDLSYLTSSPMDQGRSGGIGPLLWNTLVIVLSAFILAFPVALCGAILVIYHEDSQCIAVQQFCQVASRVYDVGVSVPRLLWGLAGAMVFGGVLGLGITAISGVLTLACLMVTIMAAGFIEGLRQEKHRLGEIAQTLGIEKSIALAAIILPASKPALLTSSLLALGRGMGDAAALLLTAGFSLYAVSAPDQAASTLAVMIYFLAVEIGGGREAALSAAFVLLVLTAFLTAPLLLFSNHVERSQK